MKKLLLIAIVLVFSSQLKAQYYNDALGLRINDGLNSNYAAFTYKKFKTDEIAYDFTLGTNFDNGVVFTFLYEIHKPTGFIDRLNWYYGGGAHISLYSYKFENPIKQTTKRYSSIGLGLDGVVGLEYSVGTIPFAFSLDYIPAFSITRTSTPSNYEGRDEDWDGSDAGFTFNNWTLGIKYTFGSTSLGAESKK